jgi:pimeloyl-ACP methyl ester carboxylesterase
MCDRLKLDRVATAMSDIATLLLVAPLPFLYAATIRSNFDPSPETLRRGRRGIIGVHGNGSSEIQWRMSPLFFKDEKFGSFFTLNLDGICTNQAHLGIPEYGQRLALKTADVCFKTGINEVDYVTHSLGGFVAACCAINSLPPPIKVRKIVFMSTPWEGSPLLAAFSSILPSFRDPIRYRQMRNEEGFIDKLKAGIAKSEIRCYYIYSTADNIVPDQRGKPSNVDAAASNVREFNHLGHYGPPLYPEAWIQTEKWLGNE